MQTVQLAPPHAELETRPLSAAPPSPPADPVVRKRAVQDLMAQMQGPYDFMQVRSCPRPSCDWPVI